MKIIAVVGQPSSGKDTVAEYIAAKGFFHISSSDAIRDDMRALGLPLDRDSMSKFAAERRQEVGNEYPLPSIVENIAGDTVISALRNTAEIDYLKQKFGADFTVIAVEAPVEARYERARQRGRIGDDISLEQVIKEQEQERANKSGVHEVDKVIANADHLVLNDSTKEALYEKVDNLLQAV